MLFEVKLYGFLFFRRESFLRNLAVCVVYFCKQFFDVFLPVVYPLYKQNNNNCKHNKCYLHYTVPLKFVIKNTL